MDKPINIKTPVIKTLDEILADMGEPVSAKTFDKNSDNADNNNAKKPNITNNKDSNTKKSLKKPTTPIKNTQKPISQTSPANPPHKRQSQKSNSKPSAVDLLLNDNTQTVLDDNLLKLLSKVEIEKLAIPDRQTRYLRWLAFYYLSKKELSRFELKNKLLAKDCDSVAVDELLSEFAEKGYQSDERCATMLVRESVRKGRGVQHLAKMLKKAGLDAKDFGGMDTLIAMSDVESVADGTILENDDRSDEIDWLKLAVEARCKKYGDTPPKDPKEKARQLRFLQYRGFDMDICFRALKMTLDDFE
ncbi:MAG: regulatory protein RecX [Moraxella sp.]|uniref:regulatory protein RecX n=1 Tax=Moraxella sp. TaxID=479 RepID=UPI0026DCE491|nr:regulatory protein RecX [Moraxella sp.]MDO4450480.1 regulatory protein RecX [Moraxella sp.]